MNTVEKLQHIQRSLCMAAAESCAYDNWSDAFARENIRDVWADRPTVFRKGNGHRFSPGELAELSVEELSSLGFGNWDGKGLWLIPLWLWPHMADGFTYKSISGKSAVKGVDEIDLDHRGGCIAFGFEKADSPHGN